MTEGAALPSVSVCFPVYNEEETVSEVLTEAHELLSKSVLDYEILVCDDGSSDRSKEIIKTIVARLTNFKFIDHTRNLGIHATFEELYGKAAKDFVFLNSVDRQWQTSILFEMLPLTSQADIVIAARKNKPYGFARSFISWAFNLLPLVLFGARTVDAGSVKLVRREIIERFPLVSKSPFSEAERLIRAARAGYRIVDYPVFVSPRLHGRSYGVRVKVLIEALRDVFRVWRSIYFNEILKGRA